MLTPTLSLLLHDTKRALQNLVSGKQLGNSLTFLLTSATLMSISMAVTTIGAETVSGNRAGGESGEKGAVKSALNACLTQSKDIILKNPALLMDNLTDPVPTTPNPGPGPYYLQDDTTHGEIFRKLYKNINDTQAANNFKGLNEQLKPSGIQLDLFWGNGIPPKPDEAAHVRYTGDSTQTNVTVRCLARFNGKVATKALTFPFKANNCGPESIELQSPGYSSMDGQSFSNPKLGGGPILYDSTKVCDLALAAKHNSLSRACITSGLSSINFTRFVNAAPDTAPRAAYRNLNALPTSAVGPVLYADSDGRTSQYFYRNSAYSNLYIGETPPSNPTGDLPSAASGTPKAISMFTSSTDFIVYNPLARLVVMTDTNETSPLVKPLRFNPAKNSGFPVSFNTSSANLQTGYDCVTSDLSNTEGIADCNQTYGSISISNDGKYIAYISKAHENGSPADNYIFSVIDTSINTTISPAPTGMGICRDNTRGPYTNSSCSANGYSGGSVALRNGLTLLATNLGATGDRLPVAAGGVGDYKIMHHKGKFYIFVRGESFFYEWNPQTWGKGTIDTINNANLYPPKGGNNSLVGTAKMVRKITTPLGSPWPNTNPTNPSVMFNPDINHNEMYYVNSGNLLFSVNLKTGTTSSTLGDIPMVGDVMTKLAINPRTGGLVFVHDTGTSGPSRYKLFYYDSLSSQSRIQLGTSGVNGGLQVSSDTVLVGDPYSGQVYVWQNTPLIPTQNKLSRIKNKCWNPEESKIILDYNLEPAYGWPGLEG